MIKSSEKYILRAADSTVSLQMTFKGSLLDTIYCMMLAFACYHFYFFMVYFFAVDFF